jgi:hypothetical protein
MALYRALLTMACTDAAGWVQVTGESADDHYEGLVAHMGPWLARLTTIGTPFLAHG